MAEDLHGWNQAHDPGTPDGWGLGHTRELGRCGSCAHWDTDVWENRDAAAPDFGCCKAAHEDHLSGDPPDARLIAASCCDAAWVLTRASFGCVLWEPDPATLRSLA